MNNNERLVDDNSTVSIPGNETTSPVERKKVKKEKKSGITIRELTIIGLLAGITIALGVSGYGIIPLGPLNVTTLHVPTLIGAIVEGPKVGAFVGFIFGCYSLWQNITAPNILSPLFINPIISVLPRILFPVLAYLVTYYCGKHLKVHAFLYLHLWVLYSIQLWLWDLSSCFTQICLLLK